MGYVTARFERTALAGVYTAEQLALDGSATRMTMQLNGSGAVLSGRFTWQQRGQPAIECEHSYLRLYPESRYAGQADDAPRTPSSGSGVVVSPQGLIATNWHVVEGAGRLTVYLPRIRASVEATVVAKDTAIDLAVLRLVDASPLRLIPNLFQVAIASDSSLRVGDEVFTVGFPYARELGDTPRAATGRVSSLLGIGDDPHLIQMTVPVQPGNSGGALVNSDGELVGLVVSQLSASYFARRTGSIPQNVNFAVKAKHLRTLLETLPDAPGPVPRRGSRGSATTMADRIERFTALAVRIDAVP